MGNESQTQPVEVKLDPRLSISNADLQRAAEWNEKLAAQSARARTAVEAMRNLTSQLDAFEARVKTDPAARDLLASAEALKKRTAGAIESITGWKIVPHRYSLNYAPALDDLLGMIGYTYQGSEAAPNQPAFDVLAELTKRLDLALEQWRDIRVKDVAAFNELARKRNIPALMVSAEAEKEKR